MKMKYLALVLISVGISGCGSTLAFLDEDENGKTFEQRAIQDGLVNVGVMPRQQEAIDYKQRKGLVIPNNFSNLPKPVEDYDAKKQAFRNRQAEPVKSVDVPPEVMTYEQLQQGREAGANLVTEVNRERDRSVNPNNLDYNEWRAYEDKQKQGLMARGAPVQGYKEVTPLDWNLEQKQGKKSDLDLQSLHSADKTRKTKFDPPSTYKTPAPMNNLTAEEIQKVQQAEKKNGWFPF